MHLQLIYDFLILIALTSIAFIFHLTNEVSYILLTTSKDCMYVFFFVSQGSISHHVDGWNDSAENFISVHLHAKMFSS